MHDQGYLAERFEAQRTHLQAVAFRMLGSLAEADDAVQESWLRLNRADTDPIENLGGWLTTVVARVCLDMLRTRASRREQSLDSHAREPAGVAGAVDPEQEALLADSVGLALLVVLETLTPAERLAFVLHDVFDVPFDEIAPIVERSPAAARQLASRARRRVQGAAPAQTDLPRQRAVVDAFLAASRGGDFSALLTLLDAEVVLRADRAAVQAATANAARGAPALARKVRGATAVANAFAGRAQVVQPALINGAAGAVWLVKGQPRAVFDFTIAGGTIIAIAIITEPARIGRLKVNVLAV
jgi:RNA polymerase sigma factor (sigma-70 family)